MLKNSSSSRGFSLLEILITLVIIAILAAVSVPLYFEHIAHEKRLEAEMTLTQLANALEKYFLEHNSFAGANIKSLGFSDRIAGNSYQLEMTSLTEATFAIAAVPIGDQAVKDQTCGVLTLNSLGEKGAKDLAECW